VIRDVIEHEQPISDDDDDDNDRPIDGAKEDGYVVERSRHRVIATVAAAVCRCLRRHRDTSHSR